jgi:lipopolysaccharide/colanic/teichoic acid biosynthesis glycosyltransferase
MESQMASKNKNKKPTKIKPEKNEAETRKKIADYIFAFLAILLILSLVLSAFVTY